MSLAFITRDDGRADDVLEKEDGKRRRQNTINYTLVGALWILAVIDGDPGGGGIEDDGVS